MTPIPIRWTTIVAAVLALAPLLWFGFSSPRLHVWKSETRPDWRWLQLGLPALLCVPYAIATAPLQCFHWEWFCLYALLPIAVAGSLMFVSRQDPEQHGHWLELVVLFSLGLAVDLRWFDTAWPQGLEPFNKVLLLDAGLYGFLSIRRLSGVGYTLRLRWEDWKIGGREWLFYAPVAIALGLVLGFLHWHGGVERPWTLPFTWLFIFFLIAVPEEIFFRGWMQNLLERKLGRTPSLILTSVLFGLAHFNKRTAFFNWRYVLLAAIAGIFYGRAWRQQRRIGASAITHASVDTLWRALLR